MIFSTDDTMVMGILNLTEDSFYDGGKYKNKSQIIEHCKKMLDDGAKIIDIGAQTSKPGSNILPAKSEIKKLLPVIELLKTEFPNIIISIDTFWSETAEKCIQYGADIINDISAGNIDNKMFNTISKLQIPYIIMHMKGIPKTMQKKPMYVNVVDEIIDFFRKKIEKLHQKDIYNIVIDPGFGFGKTLEQNYEILNNLAKFKEFNLPVLVGTSRKSMIYKILDTTPENSLNGTSITNTLALQKDVNILRVHDVKEAMECIKITKFAKNSM